MTDFLGLWWVFPSSVLFATVAVGAGVSGALFFSPFFMIVVGLSPAQAVGAGLLTESFGMGNGLRSYVRRGLVDYATARWLLVGAVPFALAGALVAHRVPDGVLRGVFGAGLVALASFLLLQRAPETCEPGEDAGELMDRKSAGKGTTVIEAADGTVFEYPTCWRLPGVLLASVGGALTGLVSAGLPEISTTQLVVRCRIPPRVAVATSVFTLAITAVAAAAVHAAAAAPAWSVVGWSVPGVLVGSTLGSRVGEWLPSDLMETVLGGVFAAVGLLVLVLQFTGRYGG
ncbi:MAG: sulfite exporter TauE/SafE family protein [Gemmatimonadota bacterium]